MMDIKPIKTEQDYAAALLQISSLMSAKLNTPEGDLLDVLTTLLEAYEAQHYPIDPPDPIEAVKFRLEQEHLTRKDLELILKVNRGRVSELLTKKRPLTLKMMRILHDRLGVPAEALLKEYSLHKDHQRPS
jgi:HTH-type transcriptional regulator/antitoxin HigA